MSNGVEFEEDAFSGALPRPSRGSNVGGQPVFSHTYTNSNYDASNSTKSGMVAWLVRHNIAKSENSAQIILICVVVFNIAVTFIALVYFL